MVLKRLIFTALGLASLLGFGTAMGQGNGLEGNGGIPAPKVYGDITKCARVMLPTSPTAMGSMSILELKLAVDRTTGDADIDLTDAATDGRLIGLLMPDDDTTNCDNPVALGYEGAVTRYDEYVRTKDALPSAGADPDPDATAAYNAAKADRDAYGGAVYNEVYNQQMRLKAVRDAVMKYNELVGTGGRSSHVYDKLQWHYCQRRGHRNQQSGRD